VERACSRAELLKTLLASFSPEYVFSGPTAVLQPGDRVGRACMATVRECCTGGVCLLELGAPHAEGLASARRQADAASLITDAVGHLLQLI